MKLRIGFIVFSMLTAPFAGLLGVAAQVADVDELRSSIDERAKELEKLNEEITAVEAGLQATKAKGQGIERDISRLNANISQLNLRVRAGEVSVEKLRLELRDLSFGIQDIRDSIGTKREAIAASLRLVQQRDHENALILILKSGSLSESVAEAQRLSDLNTGLGIEIVGLESLQEKLGEKLSSTDNKKQSIEIETKSARHQQALIADQKSEREYLLGLTKAEQREYEAQLQELEEQQSSISEVIEELEHKLRASFDPSLLPLKRPGVIGYPVANVLVTQEYGPTAFAQRAYKSKTHGGTDFRASIGTPILAAEDGVVLASDNNDKGTRRWQKFQYGRYIMIKHNNNLATLYAHLSNSVVSAGQDVKRGDVIGYAGNSGYSTGPHLHFGVYWEPSIQFKTIPPAAGLVPIGVTIDPEDYL